MNVWSSALLDPFGCNRTVGSISESSASLISAIFLACWENDGKPLKGWNQSKPPLLGLELRSKSCCWFSVYQTLGSFILNWRNTCWCSPSSPFLWGWSCLSWKPRCDALESCFGYSDLWSTFPSWKQARDSDRIRFLPNSLNWSFHEFARKYFMFFSGPGGFERLLQIFLYFSSCFCSFFFPSPPRWHSGNP